MAAGIDPPHRVSVHGFLLVGGEKMSKTAFNQIAPADLVPIFGVDGYRYHFLRDQQFGPDGDFSYEAMVARYNADLANNLGNLLARVGAVVQQKCGGIGPAPRPRQPPWPHWRPRCTARPTRPGRARLPARRWRRPGSWCGAANAALEAAEPWRAEPGPAVDAVLGDALEVLRIVAVLASPALTRASAEIWRRIGMAGSPLDARLPDAAEWGGYPGGVAVERRRASFPPPQGLAPPVWCDSHCHLAYQGLGPRRSPKPARPGSPAWSRWDRR